MYRRRLADANGVLAHKEALIGTRDLLQINYLERGLRAARAVCRVVIRAPGGQVLGHGTGFLVSPRLLLTNHHVLVDADEARHSLAEFDYELDGQAIPKAARAYRFEPDEVYLFDPNLDFALVAVGQADLREGRPLGDLGHLRLRRESGKAVLGERVSIIQHPGGAWKQIAARANRILQVVDDFIHYETDTEEGSSGAPVFSDEWEVVALHHASLTLSDERVANEGVRIHNVVARLQEMIVKPDEHHLTRAGIEIVREALRSGDPAAGPYVVTRDGVSFERRNASWYAEAAGYDREFLGFSLPLPDLVVAPHDASQELKYRNFSIVMRRSRRQALYTACNMDGALVVPSSRSASWKSDPRLELRYQLSNAFFQDVVEHDGRRRVNFIDRGHLVKRTDPSWGDIGEQAIDDTFHYTNAALQHRSFNNGFWGKLEDAVAWRVSSTFATVFTGPVFFDDDPVIRVRLPDGSIDEERVPRVFWKVMAFANDEGYLAAAAFRQSQAELLAETRLDFEAAIETLRAAQVSIASIEAETGLDFHYLRDYDSMPRIESARRGSPVFSATDLRVAGSGRKDRRVKRDGRGEMPAWSVPSLQHPLRLGRKPTAGEEPAAMAPVVPPLLRDAKVAPEGGRGPAQA